jgi:hypothetical protein
MLEVSVYGDTSRMICGVVAKVEACRATIGKVFWSPRMLMSGDCLFFLLQIHACTRLYSIFNGDKMMVAIAQQVIKV